MKKIYWILIVLAVFVSAYGLSYLIPRQQREFRESVDLRFDDGIYEVSNRWRMEDFREGSEDGDEMVLRMTASGDFRPTDDDKAISWMNADAEFRVTVTDSKRVRHIITLEHRGESAPVPVYTVDGNNHDMDDFATEIFQDAVLRLLRISGTGYQQRSERIFTESGLNGLFAEMEKFLKQMPKRDYVIHILENHTFNETDQEQILDWCNDNIEYPPYLETVTVRLLETQATTDLTIRATLKVARDIESESRKVNILQAAVRFMQPTEDLVDRFLDVAKGIRTDRRMRTVLLTLINKHQDSIPSPVYVKITGFAAKELADVELGLVLENVAQYMPRDEENRKAFEAALDKISDRDRKTRLMDMLK